MPRANTNELPSPDTLLALPAIIPRFAREIGKRATEIGIHHALTQTFKEAGIHVSVEGEIPATDGLVVASDHRQRTEIPLLQITLAEAGRDPAYFLTEPVSSGGRLLQATGAAGRDVIVPILPRERRTTARERYRQLRYPNIYGLDTPVIRAVNERSLTRAAQLAGEGAAIGINPGPTGVEAADARWGSGLGRIVTGLSDEAWETTQLGVFRADTFSNTKLVRALALRDAGFNPKPQEIVVRTATLGTADELFGERSSQPTYQTARAITDRIQGLYREEFRDVLEG